MIEYDARSYLKLVLRLRGSIFESSWKHVTLCVVISFFVALYDSEVGRLKVTEKPFSILIFAIGFLLVFKTQLSYSRYWEGRSTIGTMIYQCRDLSRQVGDFVDSETEQKRQSKAKFGRFLKSFFAATRMHLRDEKDVVNLEFLTESEQSSLQDKPRVPLIILSWCSKEIASMKRENAMTEFRVETIDLQLSGLIQSFNGLDKIKSTPIPFPYSQMLAVFLCGYCFSVPFTLVQIAGWYTPIPVAAMASALFGINAIGIEIEDPFGYDPNDLDVTKMNTAVDADINMFMLTTARNVIQRNIEKIPGDDQPKKAKQTKKPKKEKIENEIDDYVNKHQLNAVFKGLFKSIVQQQPNNLPLFVLNHLEQNPTNNNNQWQQQHHQFLDDDNSSNSSNHILEGLEQPLILDTNSNTNSSEEIQLQQQQRPQSFSGPSRLSHGNSVVAFRDSRSERRRDTVKLTTQQQIDRVVNELGEFAGTFSARSVDSSSSSGDDGAVVVGANPFTAE